MHSTSRLPFLCVFLAVFASADAAPMKLKVAKHVHDRLYVVAEKQVPASRLAPPFKMTDATGNSVACQWEPSGDGNIVRWMVLYVPKDESPVFILDHGDPQPTWLPELMIKDMGGGPMQIKDVGGGSYSISNGDREITRYNVGPLAEKFKKPYFYPITVLGRSITRAWPIEDKPNEAHDHPHHTGLYFAHGDINGKDYWSKLPIVPKSLKHSAGPVYGHLIIENAWGEDLLESQDIFIFDAGPDVLMDWSMTWKAPGNTPVALGKTKEGTFAIRVATKLTSPDPGKTTQAGRGTGKLFDAFGNDREEKIRPENRGKGKQPAPWAVDYGLMDGVEIGVCFMNHPASYRYPTDWHVRNYGLFAANAFMLEADTLKPNQPITFRYRVYIHKGDVLGDARIAGTYQGYLHNKVEGE